MLRALERLIGLGSPQLALELFDPPQCADDLKRVLVRLGLDVRYTVKLTENRTVFVSFGENELRIHKGYLGAPENVLRAVVRFVRPRTRADRREAKRTLLGWEIPAAARAPRKERTAEQTHPADERFARELARHHSALNAERFGGELSAVPIRVSRRMKSRLGHYTWRGQEGRAPEIVISRRHIRRNGWEEAVHTLLHEMVHQWQDEQGLPIDHGRDFRRKAKAVGIVPRARRVVA